jgi:Flp pilus assembly protein protease CpaA
MRKHLDKNWFVYILGIPFIIISIFFPEAKLEATGGFAWAIWFIALFVGFSLIYIGIFGGEISYSSRGIKGWISEMKKGKRN